MSVLFKALQRAEKIRGESGASGAGAAGDDIGVAASADAAPRGMPGLGGRGKRRPRGRVGPARLLIRGLGLSFIASMAVSVGAMVLFPDEVEEAFTALVLGEPAPRPRPPVPAAVTPPVVPEPVVTPSPVVASAPTVAPEQTVGQAPVPESASPAPVVVAEAAPVPPADPVLEAAAPDTAAGPTTDIVTLMAAARAVQQQNAPLPATPAPATPSVGERGGPVRLTGLDAPQTTALPPESLDGGEQAAPTPPDPRPLEDVLADRARAQQARAVAAPVVVDRPEARRAGAGDAVTVALPSLRTRDTVAGAYRSLLRGDYHSALASYEAVLEEDPRSLQALLGRAAALHKLRRLDEARLAYERVLAADSRNREALTNLLAITAAGAPQEALGRLHALERAAPDFTPVLAQIALVYGQMGADAQAIAYLQKAVAQDPANLAYRYNLAILLDRAGQVPAAAQAYRAVLDGLRAQGAAGGASGGASGGGEGGVAGLSADSIKARLDYLIAAR